MEKYDENLIVTLVYEQVNKLWNLFPNIWKITTKDELVSDSFADLYRKRRDGNGANIIYYFNTKGARMIQPLIATVVYRCMQYVAREQFSGGQSRIQGKKALRNASSLDALIDCGSDEGTTYGELLEDKSIDIEREVDYIMLYDSLPDKKFKEFYYFDGEKYKVLSYKTIIKQLVEGYTINQVSQNIFRSKDLKQVHCQVVYNIVSEMRDEIKEKLEGLGYKLGEDGSLCI